MISCVIPLSVTKIEATEMSFGLRAPLNAHSVPFCLKSKLPLCPRVLLSNQPLSQKQRKHDLFCVRATKNTSDAGLESTRPLIQFPPSPWGDYFLSLPVDNFEFDEMAREIESVMKPNVRDRLLSSHSGDRDKICLIYLLVSLGISHYFENEIEMILSQAFGKLDDLIAEENGLENISIMFEVFRLYGHKISCDIFEKFKGEDGRFKESLVEDVRGILQLYQAAHFGTPSEDIMEEALSFSRKQLESLAVQEASTTQPHLLAHIRNAMDRARYHNAEVIVAREYISFYDQEEGHDETLLKFAKLSFNYCRLLYVQELKTLTKWWKDLDVASNLPYVRDRIVESHFCALAMYFEPKYSLGRIIVAKLIMIEIVMDDTCDAYGTFPEVKSLIDSLQRWDFGATHDELPSYLRIVLRHLLETLEEIAREMKPRGRSTSVRETIEEIKKLGRAYVAISKWARASHVPTFEEYMEVGVVTSGMDDFVANSFIGMEDCAEKPFFEWFHSNPKILQVLNVYYRIKNDIATFEREMSIGEVANGVNCYMKQHGVTKEEAVDELNKIAKDNYKIAMEEFLTTAVDVPRPVLMRCLSIARMIEMFYKGGIDIYTNPHGNLKDIITSLSIHPITV